MTILQATKPKASSAVSRSGRLFLGIYANTFKVIQPALDAYDRDVKDGDFPSANKSYELHPANLHIAKHAA
jgi:hypothetical protein